LSKITDAQQSGLTDQTIDLDMSSFLLTKALLCIDVPFTAIMKINVHYCADYENSIVAKIDLAHCALVSASVVSCGVVIDSSPVASACPASLADDAGVRIDE
jgi:hypothetical protein